MKPTAKSSKYRTIMRAEKRKEPNAGTGNRNAPDALEELARLIAESLANRWLAEQAAHRSEPDP